ncbi:Sugar kinase of the NBD/HSP70 family, may contain an N-terminal HTH domain [Sinosporangium album]|uniref:Sugar kinase of the NBD/HSP70 family, may contain an N-terminal HTH domain n=1 Tax=Sinosporangium album TaxID=504805 RepID=A0A1G8DP86_9ACTN|nr:ROK family transcriptional regulator [Sinosporangium album]SDH59486.1 Sugar kinase of the NBD/HSP70 family, may contain an N-terminal HTH domain [Sinosporangium album]
MSQSTPGTPSLLRAINDRAALQALLERGPLTRPEIGTITGLSKPTASQLLARLQEAGLVVLDGIREGLPGRTAELYRINPEAAHVAALDVTPSRIEAAVADITGAVAGRHRLATPGRAGGDVVHRVREAIEGACAAASVPASALRRAVIGIQGAIDPATGRLGYAAHIPGWHIADLLGTLREGLGVPVDVENDVNLVALAEQARGVARGHSDFVLLWADEGIGSALVLGGRLHRGATGGAGEVGYMPAVGAPTAREAGRRAEHGFQALAGGPTVRSILRSYGVRGATPAAAVQNAINTAESGRPAAARAADGLREVARRLATGLASVCAVVDPALVVLTGGMLIAGGDALRDLVEQELHALTLPRPPLRLSTVEGNPVLTGALDLALDTVRSEVFGSTIPS